MEKEDRLWFIQYLVSLVVNKESDKFIRVKLDTENYRERRKATLENLAKNIAIKVKRIRKPVALEPMNHMKEESFIQLFRMTDIVQQEVREKNLTDT